MSGATPTHAVDELLTLAVTRPTLGCRQLSDALEARGLVLSKSSVQRLLVTHDAPGVGSLHHRRRRRGTGSEKSEDVGECLVNTPHLVAGQVSRPFAQTSRVEGPDLLDEHARSLAGDTDFGPEGRRAGTA